MDIHGMISSSLASVIRQSLNPDFRKECYLLLGVTNNRDAQNVINSQLKLRDSYATEKKRALIEKQKHGTQKQSAGSYKQVPEQSAGIIDCKLPITAQESHSVTQKQNAGSQKPVPEQSTGNMDKLRTKVQESHGVFNQAADNTQNISKLSDPSIVQEIKIEPVDPVESAPSDDETQLDWDTDV